jgi:RNA polymerase sigma-70 factor (ECF subfamily)
MMRARNELPKFNMGPLAIEPPRHSHDEALVDTLRTDDDLVQAAQSGDHEAFAELCRRHAQPVRRRILGIVRHQEDAEDALQETLLRAYANLGRFRQSSKFSTWITAIGINAALTVIRKRKSRRELNIEPNSPGEAAWDIADHAPDPERHVAKKQILLFLRTELQTLPPQMREVVTNYYDQDYSLQEAADTLGISLAAFKSRLLRGRRSLRLSFEQKGLLSSYPEWQ